MGWIADVVSSVIAILVAAVGQMLANDLEAWTPHVVQRLIDQAVSQLLDEESRERFGEEWRSHVADVPGCLGKVWVAANFLIASRAIARESRAEAAWVTPVLDVLAFRGAKIVQRSLLRALREELLKQCDPVLCDRAVQEVERRFEPRLRKMLRSRFTQFGGYHKSADDIRDEFANVILDYRRELQRQITQASHGSDGGAEPD